MSTYMTLFITAEMTADRTLDSILAEYNVSKADVKIDGNYVSFYIDGKRNERLIPPQNGVLWVLWDDSGYYVTNDKKGKFFKYFIKTEDNELCLNEEQTVSLLKERISEMVVPVFCSRRENIWVNHWLWQASQKSRAGSPGTRSQLAAMRSSSSLRTGSEVSAALRRAASA